MATTLNYGFILPNTGDKGSVWFPALETNITKLSEHNHNGSNSAKIPSTSISAVTVAIPINKTVDAGNFILNKNYTIKEIGTTDFTLIGAASNTVGLQFIATGVGSGTGKADVAAWELEGSGKYYQEILIPNDANYADVFVMVKNAAGEQMFLDVKPVSGNAKKFKVYSNDNTLSATAHILV